MIKSKRNKLISLALLVAFFVCVVTADHKRNEEVELKNIYKIDKPIVDVVFKEYVTFEIVDEGYDIYDCGGHPGYRYGPSIIYYEDGSMDAYFSSPGNNSTEWDYIRYRHFDGENWSKEKIVLKPTKNSNDRYSCCDPGVIYFDGYYYIGYTSTCNSSYGGVENNAFVARSENPDGPFEKWDGTSWGGKPEPIIRFEGNEDAWGIGEISFVINDDKLYCYYSYIDENNTTKLAIADLCEDWPNTLELKGDVLYKKNGKDSYDVAYVDEYEKFIAISVEERFYANSSIAVLESSDGINFESVENVRNNVVPYAHNIGITKDLSGHIDINNENLMIGYAYGSYTSWGKWNTRFQPIKITTIIKKG